MRRHTSVNDGLAGPSMPLVAGCSSNDSGASATITSRQVVRHEGHERAFFDMDAVTHTV